MARVPTYRDFENQFPNYIILQKEGFMYTAHGRSAEVFAYAMDYKLVKTDEGLTFTGGPDPDKIARVLKAQDYNFIIVENHRIVDGHSGRDPFL